MQQDNNVLLILQDKLIHSLLCRLFKWLPLYNLVVIALSLAYQAPLPGTWHGGQVRGCRVQTVM